MSPQPWVITRSLSVAQTLHSQWSQDVHRWHNFTLRNTFTDYQAATEETWVGVIAATFTARRSASRSLNAQRSSQWQDVTVSAICFLILRRSPRIVNYKRRWRLADRPKIRSGSAVTPRSQASHQRQPGSAPDQHTDPVLFVRWNKIVKKKMFWTMQHD